jgi:NAD(P)-dependent dehydrogenase (short-subunit alcohol dehydrogenase family)
MDLRNKVAWITGGARMGVAVARVLSQEGCRIVLTYRQSRRPAEETVRQLIADGGEASALQCDLTQTTQIEKTAREIVRHYKRLDVLVNLSSIYEKAPLSNSRLAGSAWDAHMAANAKSAYALSGAVAPWMKRSGGGRIVHISDWTSASGRPRYKDYSAYYVSKVAIKGVVETMALELAPKILVNAIAPGPILPPPGLSTREYQAVIKATPVARWGGADEIAKAVRFLTQSDFVTGETIRVDGGRHLL